MKLITVLENLKNDKDMYLYDKVDILLKIADEYSVYDTVNQIVQEDVIDDIIKDYTWDRVYFFLAEIKVLNQEFYYLNGYGNLENLTSEKIDIILEDFISEIKYKGLANEEIENEECEINDWAVNIFRD